MEFQVPTINLLVALPVIILAATAMLMMLLELFVPDFVQRWAPWISLGGLTVAFIQVVGSWGYVGGTFTLLGGAPMVVVDNFATFLNITFVLTGALAVLLSVNYLRRTGLDRPEFYMLMLFSLSGMMLMGMANDLILIFLALELLSIPLYILSGFAWPRPESEESAMKYFVLGAFSSSILVFGIALIYGATGTTSLPLIFASIVEPSALLVAGAAMTLVGFGFKIAVVPFQLWTPDVYEGAPTAAVAFMSVGSKVAGFAALMRIMLAALPQLSEAWVPALAVIAALTLIVGNVVAITQSNIKRMLGYSSIAHAGYIMIAVAASFDSPDGVSAALFYMFAYLFTNLGAFAVVIAMEHRLGEGVMLDDYKGLARRSPWIALAMAYFMLSLTGVPPTGGFSGKFFVFRAAIEANLTWLAVIGVLTSVVSGFYYLRVVYLMYMYEGEAEVKAELPLRTAVAFTALATLLLGILPGWGFEIARAAIIQGSQIFLAGG